MVREMYDYIIVGGGIYGRLIAYKLTKEKYKIMLVDKKDLSKGYKLNYMIITNYSYNFLCNMIDTDIDSFIVKNINSITINNKDYKTNRYVLNIKKLNEYLLNNIKNSKNRILSKSVIDKYGFKNNELVINNKKYKYKYLIGADGTLSEVRMNKTRKIQRFNVAAYIKYKKNNDNIMVKYNSSNKLYEEIIPVRTNNIIRIVNNKRKNNIFKELNNIKNNYNISSKCVDTYLIPRGDVLIKDDNIYFIGDASGMINPFNNLSMDYNLEIISKFPNINNKDIKKIKKDIRIKLVVSKLIYLPIIKKLVFKLIKKICKEENLC